MEGNPVSYFDPFGLEKVNRDKLHGVLAGIGTVAFFVGLFFGGSEIVAVVAYAVSAVSGGLNGGLYLDEAIDAETDEARYESIGNFGLNILGIGTGANANATIHSEFDVCFDKVVGGVNSTGTVLDFVKWVKKIIETIGKEIKKNIGGD